MPKRLRFFRMHCLKTILPLNYTTSSTAKKTTIRTSMHMSLWPTHTAKKQSRWSRKQRCWKSSFTRNTTKWCFPRQTGVLKRRLSGIVAASGKWMPQTQLRYR